MQNVIIDRPYKFVEPVKSKLWPKILGRMLPWYLDRMHGVESCEFLGTDRLKASVDSGHGIMLAPNHCRPPDPMVVGRMADGIGVPLYIMASWHMFMQSAFQTWMLRRMGVFSVYREGLDRESLKFAIQALAGAERPLVLFPEGVITRTNDRLNNLMEGTAFLARNAAKQRSAGGGKVVVHPVAIRYFCRGNVEQAVLPMLEEIERRLTWRPDRARPLMERIIRIGNALLTLKEIEYVGRQMDLPLEQRLSGLVDALLVPLENEWLKGKREGDVVARVKSLRAVILPDMVAGEIPEEERARRWQHLERTYIAQLIHFYPPEYFGADPSPEQMLEIVEHYEEDITDDVRVNRPIHAVLEVGEAIEVGTAREKSAEGDPLMVRIRGELETMLKRLKDRRPA